MITIVKPLTAIERAHAAYELMLTRKRHAVLMRQAREHRRRIKLGVGAGLLVAFFLGVAVYNGWFPSSFRSSVLTRAGAIGHFAETRIGQVRSVVKGDTCRELQFSNDEGIYIGGSLVSCDVAVRKVAPPPESSAGARVNSIRDAFQR
ncbi:MAG: hypothetical protein ACRECO_03340 [Xanthobacteraceae bacterium]